MNNNFYLICIISHSNTSADNDDVVKQFIKSELGCAMAVLDLFGCSSLGLADVNKEDKDNRLLFCMGMT